MWNTLGTIVYFACQWLITILVVWLYGDFADTGNLHLAMNITNIFHCVAAYNVRAYQVSDVRGEFADSVYVLTRAVTCFGATLLCAGFVLVSGYTAGQVLVILCYMVFRAVEAFVDVLHGIVQKRRRLDIAGISMISRGLLMLGAFYVLGRVSDLLTAVAGMAVFTALFALAYDVPKAKKMAAIAAYKPKGISAKGICSKAICLKDILPLIKRCFPLMLVILTITFFVSYTRYSVERIYGTEGLGAYGTATIPAVAIQVAVLFILAPLTNLLSECVENPDRKRFVRISAAAGGLVAALTLAAYAAARIAGRWGLGLVFGADILPYAYLLPSATIAMGLTASLWFMNVVFSTIRDIKGLLSGILFGVAVCAAATVPFIRGFGLIGANYALVLCQGAALAALCVRFFLCRKEYFTTRVE